MLIIFTNLNPNFPNSEKKGEDCRKLSVLFVPTDRVLALSNNIRLPTEREPTVPSHLKGSLKCHHGPLAQTELLTPGFFPQSHSDETLSAAKL